MYDAKFRDCPKDMVQTSFEEHVQNVDRMSQPWCFLHQRSAIDPLRQEFEVEIWPEK